MAGFRVLWANEYDVHAQKCYRANSKAIIDKRSIVDVKASEILESVGLAVGELDVFDGSPPVSRILDERKAEGDRFAEFAL